MGGKVREVRVKSKGRGREEGRSEEGSEGEIKVRGNEGKEK